MEDITGPFLGVTFLMGLVFAVLIIMAWVERIRGENLYGGEDRAEEFKWFVLYIVLLVALIGGMGLATNPSAIADIDAKYHWHFRNSFWDLVPWMYLSFVFGWAVLIGAIGCALESYSHNRNERRRENEQLVWASRR